MSIKKSQIKQAYEPEVQEELDIFKKTMSPYLTGTSNEIMQGFLKRLEMIKMNNYNSVKFIQLHRRESK